MNGMPPSMRHNIDKMKPPKPKNIKDYPRYIYVLISGFFSRLFYIFRLVWETKKSIFFAMLAIAVFKGVFPVLGAYISALLLNKLAEVLLGSINFTEILFLLIFQFIYLFLNKLLNNLDTLTVRLSGELVANHIKEKILDKAKEIDVARFDIPEFYEKLENANREAGIRPVQILNSSFTILSTFISIISFIVALWAISPFAPIIIAILALPAAIITFSYRKKNVRYMRFHSKERRQMEYFSNLVTNKDLVKEIRLFNLSEYFIERYRTVFKKYYNGLKNLIIKENVLNTLVSVLTTIANCILFLYVAYKVYNGELMVGDYSFYTGALNSISSGVGTIVSTTATVFEGTLFIDNMIEFMKDKKKIVPLSGDGIIPEKHSPHKIEFKNVSFRYPGTRKDVLKNINLTLEAGETTVLVGLNGAGKTTLIKLLTRLYDPTEGTVLLDNKDIREYNVKALYDLYGIIFQDFGKYAVTVKENIAFGQIDKKIDSNNIELAAKQSDSTAFIEKMPDKYNTPLMRFFEENGIEPSIGQWQKLSVARAFYSDSDILILDEPTASLDAIAEQAIFEQFDTLRKDKLTLFVSHRLSSATVASKIVVLLNGEIVEMGNHSELMEAKGHYYQLFSTQAKRYIESNIQNKDDIK